MLFVDSTSNFGFKNVAAMLVEYNNINKKCTICPRNVISFRYSKTEQYIQSLDTPECMRPISRPFFVLKYLKSIEMAHDQLSSIVVKPPTLELDGTEFK